MNELGPDARAILDAARNGDEPTDVDRRRVHASLARKIGVGAAIVGTTAATSATAGGATIVAGVSTLTKVVLVVVGVVTAVGGSAYVVHRVRTHETNAPVVTHAVSPPPIVESVVAPAPTLAPMPAPAPTPAPAPSSPIAAPVTTTPSLDDEISLIQRSQSLLSSGDAAGALALVDRHDKQFPNGALSEESAGVRVLALCALGRSDAKKKATSFLSAHPSSPMAAHIRSACDVE